MSLAARDLLYLRHCGLSWTQGENLNDLAAAIIQNLKFGSLTDIGNGFLLETLRHHWRVSFIKAGQRERQHTRCLASSLTLDSIRLRPKRISADRAWRNERRLRAELWDSIRGYRLSRVQTGFLAWERAYWVHSWPGLTAHLRSELGGDLLDNSN